MKESPLERKLREDMEKHGIPYEQEVTFHPERKWRMDFKLKGHAVFMEVQGGAGFGRHHRKEGAVEDSRKYAAAHRMGYTILVFTKPLIEEREILEYTDERGEKRAKQMDTEAIETLRAILEYGYWKEEGAA